MNSKFGRDPAVLLLGSLGLTGLIVLIWWGVVAAQLVSPVFLPPPGRTFAHVCDQLLSRSFWASVAVTMARMVMGFSFSALLGVGIGALVGSSEKLRPYVDPTLEFLRPLPASAMIPVFILLLGLTEKMILAVVVFGSLWPILLATVHGFRAIDIRLREVARVLELTNRQFFTRVALPSAIPGIFGGIRLSLTVSLIITVAVEMIAGSTGLGHNIIIAARSFDGVALFSGIIVLGVLGYMTVTSLDIVEARLLRWKL